MPREHSRFGLYADSPAILRRGFPPVLGGLAYIDTTSALTPMQYVLVYGGCAVLCTRGDGASWIIPVETEPLHREPDRKTYVFQHISARGSCVALQFTVDEPTATTRVSAWEIDCSQWLFDAFAPLFVMHMVLNHGKLPRNCVALVAGDGTFPMDIYAPRILLLNISTGRRDWYTLGCETAKWRLRPVSGSWVLRREYAVAAFGEAAVADVGEHREYITCTQGDHCSYLLS